ncbi:hypothetical protein B0H11DRAFT_2252649 [Mycena galericulata]|nr:hypothetical protein B0H11DRAFT_2252649 [Mycena galericulata]
MEANSHIQYMYPHLARQQRRRNAPPSRRAYQQAADLQGPYGHGLDGGNAPPIVVTRPAAYRAPAAPKRTSADQALRDNDAKLLARLAESKTKREGEEEVKRQLKRKAATAHDGNAANKRTKMQSGEALSAIHVIQTSNE